MTTTETEKKPWHLSGNWMPMLEETTSEELEIEGNIPEELVAHIYVWVPTLQAVGLHIGFSAMECCTVFH